MSSIRRHLLIWLLSALLSAAVVAGALIYRKAQDEVNELFDYQLRQMALSLHYQSFIQRQNPARFPDDTDFVTQIWDSRGGLLYYSHPNLTIPLPPEQGFATVSSAEGAWRVYTIAEGSQLVQVAQPMTLRIRSAEQIALRMLVPLLAAVPLLGLLIWITIGKGLRPLLVMARALQSRTPDSLDPLPTTGLPQEIRPLAGALNDLLDRLGRALKTEREFIQDAAHELRTPLTAVQLQIQLLERASSEEERAAALANLKSGVQRTSHLVNQLLTMARIEPEAFQREFAAVNLDALINSLVAEYAPIATAQHIDLGISRSEPGSVMGDADSLRILFGNLIDNALRYTPAGGKVDVSVRSQGEHMVVEVTDTGPGIPREERERVFDRFYRQVGSQVPGSGLGLAIVRRIADHHGATVTLEDGDGGIGLKVRVAFRRA